MFLPDRSSDYDGVVRRELASSLRHVAAAGGTAIRSSRVDLEEVCREIERHRVEPAVFGRYYELVLALKAGRTYEAAALWREIADQARHSPSFRIVPFGDPSLGTEDGRYLRWLSPQGGTPLIEAPDRRRWADFEASIPAAFALVEEAEPALGVELRNLILEVVGAARHRDAPDNFGGASTFMLWGTVFLNVDAHATRVDAAAGLIHEGAHQLLFGLSCREPLLSNALSERYESPLRDDPRPIIGIYHATFVCARMLHAYAAMLRPGLGLTEGERHLVEERLGSTRGLFTGGMDTLRRKAQLTSLGRRLLDEAGTALERT